MYPYLDAQNIYIILWILSPFVNNAQDTFDPTIIERNNIQVIEGYIFEGENSLDSNLITKEYFNIKGYRTKIEIYSSTGIRSEYIYKYQGDTLNTERITKFGNEIDSTTKLYYDKKLREIKAIDFDGRGKKTGTYSIIKYNDRRRTKETMIYCSKKLTIHTKELYDESGSLKKRWTKKNGKWILDFTNESNSGLVVEEFENINGTELKMKRQTRIIANDRTILGLNGKLKLSSDDVLKDEVYTNLNGLVEYEKQYLNNKLISLKKYKYVL